MSVPPAAAPPAAGPLPGVTVPTAPRSQRISGRTGGPTPSIQWHSDNNIKKDVPRQLVPSGSTSGSEPQSSLLLRDNKIHQTGPSPAVLGPSTANASIPREIRPAIPSDTPTEQKNDASLGRRPVIGKRELIPQAPAEAAHEASDSDSEDDLTDSYFVEEIAKIDAEVARVNAENPLNPRPEPPAVLLKPFIDSTIDDLVQASLSTPADACMSLAVKVEEAAPAQIAAPASMIAPKQKEPARSRSSTPAAARKSKPMARSRPPTPLIDPKNVESAKPNPDSAASAPVPAPLASSKTLLPSVEQPELPIVQTSRNVSIGGTLGTHAERVEPTGVPKPTHNGIAKKSVLMDVFSDSEGAMTEAENSEILEAVLEPVRPRMKTPPIASLPNFGVKKKWFEDPEFLETLKPRAAISARIKQKLISDRIRKEVEQEEARQKWGEAYLNYRTFTDFSNDAAAVRSREKFVKAKAKDAAAKAAAQQASADLSAGSKPEGTRRGRFATEADFERVLAESMLEAKESQEKESRAARAKTASAKEATIPDCAWDEEERQDMQFIDKTHLVPFERSFARLEFGEPIDNFTEEECEIFEKVYLEFPKQWSKIAAALERRDYKACIQHYYLVKHTSKLKEKLKKQPKKRNRRTAKPKNPKSNALMADLAASREETEDGPEGDNGERRGRPRRAAAPTFNSETLPSESEVASPAPTPGRKPAAAPKGDMGNDTAPPGPKKKARVVREKGAKQAKNSQLLAAAPSIVAAGHRAESPATPAPATPWARHEPSSGPPPPPPAPPPPPPLSHPPPPVPPQFPSQFDGSAPSQNAPLDFNSPFPPPPPAMERPKPIAPVNFETVPQSFPVPAERLDSAPPPPSFDTQQDRRNPQQTSSYWSVPEQNDFPALLKHFGTDWHGIAKWMTSKTHIMVYTNVFPQ